MSLLGDLEKHLFCPALYQRVGNRVWGVQVPDQQPLPYVRLERTAQETTRTSSDSIVRSTVTITAYAATAQEAEAVAAAVDARMQAALTSTPPAKTLDQRPEDDAIESEPDRGRDGTFRYAAPLSYTIVRQVPRRA